MTTNVTPPQSEMTRPEAASGLAIVRLTIGAMFVWVFFENMGKGLYTPAGYAGLIHSYIKQGHSPAAWKAVMALAANHAAIAAPMQATAEISLGVLLIIGLLTRPVAFVAFLYLASLWVSEWGPRGFGNSWSRCSRLWRLRWDAQAGPGALTLGWRSGVPRLSGGNGRSPRASVGHHSYL